jgi:hypothetical protein
MIEPEKDLELELYAGFPSLLIETPLQLQAKSTFDPTPGLKCFQSTAKRAQ